MCPFSWIGPLPSKIPSCAPVRYISYKVIHTCHTYMTLEKKGSSKVEHFFRLRDLEWEGARLKSLFSVRGRRFPHQTWTLEKAVLVSPPHVRWYIFKYIVQILRA